MPKKIYLPKNPKGYSNSGIGVEYVKTTQWISISGWFDSMIGIEGEGMPLRELFDRLGITEKDCARAFKEKK